MNNLKDTFSPMQLSEKQKQKIVTYAKSDKRKTKSYVPIVFPAFILLSVVFLFVTFGQEQGIVRNVTSASLNVPNPFESMSKANIYWSIANTVLLVVVLKYFKKCIATIVRWQDKVFIQELHAFLFTRLRSILLLSIIIIVYWIGAMLFASTLWYSQSIFALLYIGMFVFIALAKSKENVWASCPHCGKRYKRMQIFWKSSTPFRDRCDYCKENIFIHDKENPDRFSVFIYPVTTIWYHTLFDLHIALVVVLGIGMAWALGYFCLPFLMKFSADEKL